LFKIYYDGLIEIQQQLREYFRACNAQKKFLLLLLAREKKRVVEVLQRTKGLDPELKKLSTLLQSTATSFLESSVAIYFDKCKVTFVDEFMAWRQETKKLKYYDYNDDRFYWR